MCMGILPVCTHLCITSVPCAHRDLKRALDPLELGLQDGCAVLLVLGPELVSL